MTAQPFTRICLTSPRPDWRWPGGTLDRRDWGRANRQADEVAAGRAGGHVTEAAPAESGPLTLTTLFDIYGGEVTPTKGKWSQQYDEAAMKMFRRLFGKDPKPATLSQRDRDRFIRERRSGKVVRVANPYPTARSTGT